MLRLLYVLLVLSVLMVAPVWGADDYSLQAARNFDTAAAADANDPRDELYLEDRKRQDSHTILELLLLSAVAVATIAATLYAARSRIVEISGRDVIRAVVMIFVIYGALALAIDVKTTETLTGVIGVLSATAGYLFGRGSSAGEPTSNQQTSVDGSNSKATSAALNVRDEAEA